MPGYLEVSCDCPPESAELIHCYITEELAPGLEEIGDGERSVARFYLPDDKTGQNLLAQFKEYLVAEKLVSVTDLSRSVTARSISETDWRAEYEARFSSVVIDDIVIKPSWDREEYPDKLVILMDPKMAFGTGRHETTQLCVQQVREDLRPGDKVLDFGTGSGVLSILAAKLGATECLGIDNDQEAVDGAVENAALNSVTDEFMIRLGSIEQVQQRAHYDLVVSNLIYHGLLEYYDTLAAAATSDSVIILSGILDSQEEPFLEFLRGKGVENIRVNHLHEWICVRIGKGSR